MDEQEKAREIAFCEGCGLEEPCDGTYLSTFSVYVCSECRFANPSYKLITKDTAKKQFLLPDSILDELPCIRKANPKHEGFAPLRLFLQKACQDAAIQLYKSLQNIAEEKRKRERKRYEKAVQRTQTEVTRQGVFGKRRKDKHGVVRKRPIVIEEEEHVHAFQREQKQDDGTWTKECECGLSISVRKM
ncbi:unnamed protein product [Aphanomyces euteiches]|uniref:XPA C-terminal domain-containing protein n=1 Tax=Aphanomyces euteiches TaxID=100861 RepID=A0A6G0X2F5_9STRA|nr:hypothetical protein Ae201684_009256 [Aphanomyces euteiches]KAH9145765.1 hypothetical protein AeRB84_010350 [Aphanomyces euteiches]